MPSNERLYLYLLALAWAIVLSAFTGVLPIWALSVIPVILCCFGMLCLLRPDWYRRRKRKSQARGRIA